MRFMFLRDDVMVISDDVMIISDGIVRYVFAAVSAASCCIAKWTACWLFHRRWSWCWKRQAGSSTFLSLSLSLSLSLPHSLSLSLPHSLSLSISLSHTLSLSLPPFSPAQSLLFSSLVKFSSEGWYFQWWGQCVLCHGITSWCPNFNGSHFGLPPSSI